MAHLDLGGGAESLYGKIDPKTFGDRAYRGRPAELDEKLKKLRWKKEHGLLTEQATKGNKRLRLQEESVLNPREEGVYLPKTKKCREAYEAILSIIQKHMCGQPLQIVTHAVDEIISVLKNETLTNREKKIKIESMVYPVSNWTFDQLVVNGRLITDYRDEESDLDIIPDDVAFTVDVFKENEEEEDEESDMDIIPDEEDDVAEPNASIAMQMGDGIDDDDMPEANDGLTLNVQDIDAYWVQRKISQAYDQQIDPQQCQKLAEAVLKILAEGDDREVETNLLVHLQFDKFSLIKFLLHNRLKIVWCTRLARAEDQDERKNIEEEMMNHGPDLAAILDQLHATCATVKQRQKNLAKSIIEEARRFKDERGGDDGSRARVGLVDQDADNGWLTGQRQLLDLEGLLFQQGSLLMSNNKIALPDGFEKRDMWDM